MTMTSMKMMRFGLCVLTLILLLVIPTMTLAQDDGSKYSFASAQGASNLQAIPGGELAVGVIYFYNVVIICVYFNFKIFVNKVRFSTSIL